MFLIFFKINGICFIIFKDENRDESEMLDVGGLRGSFGRGV